jgi:hypothetical protein
MDETTFIVSNSCCGMGLGRRGGHKGFLLDQWELRLVSGRKSISKLLTEATAKILGFFVDLPNPKRKLTRRVAKIPEKSSHHRLESAKSTDPKPSRRPTATRLITIRVTLRAMAPL